MRRSNLKDDKEPIFHSKTPQNGSKWALSAFYGQVANPNCRIELCLVYRLFALAPLLAEMLRRFQAFPD